MVIVFSDVIYHLAASCVCISRSCGFIPDCCLPQGFLLGVVMGIN